MKTSYPYYLHAAGYPSRWSVVDVGLKCMHSCKFCYYSYLNGEADQFAGMRHAEFHSRQHLETLVRSLADNGFLGFDVTGGEPTLHPDIIEIVRLATSLGVSSRIITLGQYLLRKMRKSEKILLDELLDAGLTNFLFSMHDVNEERFRAITGESWEKQKAVMEELDRRDFHYTSNTTVFEENYRHLPDIAREILKHNIYLHNFIEMNAYYAWSDAGRAAPVQADYSKVHPYLKEAVHILESEGVGVNIRYAPMCQVAGMERNMVGILGVRHDPYEWMNNMNHGARPEKITPAVTASMAARIPLHPLMPPPGTELIAVNDNPRIAARRGGLKVFPPKCAECKAITVCDGLDKRYLEERGDGELVAYSEFRGEIRKLQDGSDYVGMLDTERLAYRAPFFVKRKPDAKMKDVLKKFTRPEPLPEKPGVGIVIACYNQGQYLERAIRSALAQTWKNIRVTMVDDGSTDNTQDIARKFNVSLIAQPNSGQPAIARNRGIAATETDFILLLDADDWIEPTMVEECLDALRKNPQCHIAYTATRHFGSVTGVAGNPAYNYSAQIHNNQFSYCSLFKREIWEAVGGFRENVKGCEDFDFWIAAAGLGYQALRVPRALFNYRRNIEGLYEQEVLPKFDDKFRQIILNNADLYPPSMTIQARKGEKIDKVIG
ncbi:MAG: glycosyltransferase [Bdellovibrionales bacterium]